MFNKIIFGLIFLALIFSLSSLFLMLKSQGELKLTVENLKEFYQKVDQEVSLVEQKIPPYVPAGEATGFVIEFENGIKFYFAADTGLTSDMKLIGEYFRPEVAFLPIGNIYTMDSKKAGFAAKLINPEYIIPTNYGSFPELESNPKKFLEELKNYNLKGNVLVFEPGKSQEVLGINVLWLGSKNWLLESPQGTRILINPGIKYNPNFPKKFQELIKLKKIDLVLVSNSHFDNFTLSDARKWGQLFDPVFICPYELGIWLKSRLSNFEILALGQGSRIGIPEMRRLGVPEKDLERIKIKAVNLVPAAHSSSLTPEGIDY